MDIKAKFIRAYSGLPISLRGEIIVVLEGKPFTWNAVYFEVKNDTKNSTKLLNKLVALKIL